MTHPEQPNLFRGKQLDLFANEPPPRYVQPLPDPNDIRRQLHKVLAEARAAETWPWPPDRVKFHRCVFPQMTDWLPPEEAEQLKREFAAELARLEAV